jgi:outer membrane protein assembly factor BamB
MRRVLLAFCLAQLLALYAPLSLSASSWLMTGHDAQGTAFNPGEQLIGRSSVLRLHTVWSYPFAVQAVATDAHVFAITVSPSSPHYHVVVLDARSGKVIHSYLPAALHLTGGPSDNPQVLAYAQGRLIVGAAREVVALNPYSGRVFWRAAGGADVVVVQGATIYTGKGCQSACGAMASYAIDLQTGRILWQHPGNFGGRPTLIGGLLYQTWGEYGGQTHVYDPHHGTLLARLPLNAEWAGDGVHTYADVRAAPGPGQAGAKSWLGRIGPQGKPAWKVNLGSVAGNGWPALAYSTLYVPSHRFHPGVIAVNAANGQIRWGADLGPDIALAAANHLLFALHQTSGRLDVLSTDGGQTVRTLTLPRYRYAGISGLFVAGGTLYVDAGNGLTALQP